MKERRKHSEEKSKRSHTHHSAAVSNCERNWNFTESSVTFFKLHFSPPDSTLCIFLPLELVFFVPDVVGLVVIEELGDACRQVAVDAVHVAGCSHDGTHVFVAVLDTFLHLNAGKHMEIL